MSVGVYFGETFEAPFVAGRALNSEISVYQPPKPWEAESISVGSKTFVPFVPEVTTLSGLRMPTFYDDWYNRIHLMPRKIDLLNVINDQSRDVVLWNAYFVNKTLNSTIFPTGQGISVTSPVVPAYVLKPLQLLTYNIVVSADGPPAIDVDLVWDITGEDLTTNIIGRRIVVWPFPPNWSDPVDESLEFLTDIVTAYAGDEQRRALRSKPRRTIEYTSLLKKEDAAISSNLLWGWQNRSFALPLWFDKTWLTAAATAGNIVLTLDTTSRGFFAGGLILLYASSTDYEAIQMDSFTSSTITLSKGLEQSWPLNTKVFPMNIVRVPRNVSAQRLTSGVLQLSSIFNCDPVQTDPYLPVVAAPVTHNGIEVVLRRPNYAQAIEVQSDFEYETVDFLLGNVYSSPTETNAKIGRRFQWILKSSAEIRDFRALLGRLKGRAKAVYMPTWFDDFELYATEAIGALSIRVKNNEFHKMVGADPALNTLMILMSDRSVMIRTIDSTSTDGTNTTLGLTTAITANLNSATVQRLSLVHLARMTTDRAVIRWLTDGRATIEANFTLVKT